jgi:hypothetical protein
MQACSSSDKYQQTHISNADGIMGIASHLKNSGQYQEKHMLELKRTKWHYGHVYEQS